MVCCRSEGFKFCAEPESEREHLTGDAEEGCELDSSSEPNEEEMPGWHQMSDSDVAHEVLGLAHYKGVISHENEDPHFKADLDERIERHLPQAREEMEDEELALVVASARAQAELVRERPEVVEELEKRRRAHMPSAAMEVRARVRYAQELAGSHARHVEEEVHNVKTAASERAKGMVSKVQAAAKQSLEKLDRRR